MEVVVYGSRKSMKLYVNPYGYKMLIKNINFSFYVLLVIQDEYEMS